MLYQTIYYLNSINDNTQKSLFYMIEYLRFSALKYDLFCHICFEINFFFFFFYYLAFYLFDSYNFYFMTF